MGSGTTRAAVFGGLLGLLFVAGLGAAVWLGAYTSQDRVGVADGAPVLVAIVLPDAEGAPVVRAVDVVVRNGDVLRATAVDPLTSATVPGTSATTLAEAYAFGGGKGLAAAYAARAGGEAPPWIVIGPQAWERLAAGSAIPVTLAEGIDVFDGERLYAFPAGENRVPAAQVSKLMDGAVFEPATTRAAIRASLGDAVLGLMAGNASAVASSAESGLPAEEVARFLTGVQRGPVRADTPQ